MVRIHPGSHFYQHARDSPHWGQGKIRWVSPWPNALALSKKNLLCEFPALPAQTPDPGTIPS